MHLNVCYYLQRIGGFHFLYDLYHLLDIYIHCQYIFMGIVCVNWNIDAFMLNH